MQSPETVCQSERYWYWQTDVRKPRERRTMLCMLSTKLSPPEWLLRQDRQQHEPISWTSISEVKELKRNHTSVICLSAWCHTATVLGQTSSPTNFVILGNTYLYYKWYLSRYSLKNSSLFLILESEYSNHVKHFISFLYTYSILNQYKNFF